LFLQHVVLEDRNRVDEGFRAAIDEGRDWHFECRIRRADGEVRWIEAFGRPTRGDKGFVDHILGIVADITDRKQEAERIQASLKEKDLLLGEIHHRVKNNLQIVESLLDLQAAQIEDPRVLDKLRDSRSRVRSMALVHRTLYQSADFARADFGSFLDALVPALITSYNVSRYRVAFTTDAEDVSLPIDAAIPCGLIVNELISNALKHAFSDGQCGEIDVTMKRHVGNQMVLSVSDNGAGIPDDLELESTATLGLQLVAGLASQLHGKLTIQRSKPTRFELTFPLVQ